MARAKRKPISKKFVLVPCRYSTSWALESGDATEIMCESGAIRMLRMRWNGTNTYTLRVSRRPFRGAKKLRVDHTGDVAPLARVDGEFDWQGLSSKAADLLKEVVMPPEEPGPAHDCPDCGHQADPAEVFVYVKATLRPKKEA